MWIDIFETVLKTEIFLHIVVFCSKVMFWEETWLGSSRAISNVVVGSHGIYIFTSCKMWRPGGGIFLDSFGSSIFFI